MPELALVVVPLCITSFFAIAPTCCPRRPFRCFLRNFYTPYNDGACPCRTYSRCYGGKNEVSNWGHLSSPSCSFRLSRHGVERVQTADLFAKPMERIRVRNCTLFKNGEAAGEDALKKGAFFGSVATLFSFHPLAIGFLAAMTARGNKDLWALDILDYDEKEWLFMVESREEGEDLLKFLDRYYMA